MLSRIVSASTTRAFSSAHPLRIPPRQAHAQPPPRPVRVNPLVGNLAPMEPAKPSSEDLPLPRPPPPSLSTLEPSEPTPVKPKYAYNALDPQPPIDIASIISEKSAAYARGLNVSNPTEGPNVRPKAVTGRTVFIKDRLAPQSATTPVFALRILDKMCRDQKIKNKFHSQKFHERKGLKKKRLRSERWRARFKTGFKAALNRVMELKKQGW